MVGFWVCPGRSAQAQDKPDHGEKPGSGGVVLAFGAEPGPAAMRIASGRFSGARVVLDPEALGAAMAAGGTERSSAELGPLREIDRLLAQARVKLAELDERAALTALSHAERLARSALSLPLSAAFYAEVELQLAVAAAQVGHVSLAQAALRRAAWLAPQRKLLAAEASPEVVALAARVWSEVTSAPEGELPIEVVNAPHAHVFLDDIDLGEAPRLVRANVGEHALRIEAPGRIAYGAVFEVAQGRRPVQRISLSPSPSVASISSLRRAASALDVKTVTNALRTLSVSESRPAAAMFLESDGKRSLLVTCDADACDAPWRIEDEHVPAPTESGLSSARTLESARAWLHASNEVSPPEVALESETPFWKRWYVWSALAVIVAGTGTAVVLAAQPAPEQRLRVVVDPTGLR